MKYGTYSDVEISKMDIIRIYVDPIRVEAICRGSNS